MNKAHKLSLTILLSLSLILPSFIQAQDEALNSTPSANQVQESLQERIKNVVKENLNQAESKLEQKIKNQTLLGYVGLITKINNTAITIEYKSQESLQIILDDQTTIVRQGKTIKPETLSIDEKIIVIGHLNSEDILQAKRIVTSTNTPPTNKRQAVLGQISEVSIKDDTFTLSTQNQVFKDIELAKNIDLDLEEIQENQTMFAIIETNIKKETHTLLNFKLI